MPTKRKKMKNAIRRKQNKTKVVQSQRNIISKSAELINLYMCCLLSVSSKEVKSVRGFVAVSNRKLTKLIWKSKVATKKKKKIR